MHMAEEAGAISHAPAASRLDASESCDRRDKNFFDASGVNCERTITPHQWSKFFNLRKVDPFGVREGFCEVADQWVLDILTADHWQPGSSPTGRREREEAHVADINATAVRSSDSASESVPFRVRLDVVGRSGSRSDRFTNFGLILSLEPPTSPEDPRHSHLAVPGHINRVLAGTFLRGKLCVSVHVDFFPFFLFFLFLLVIRVSATGGSLRNWWIVVPLQFLHLCNDGDLVRDCPLWC
ncbi:hypothetical protein EYF80_036800 [Liparis tanakae]|uniref:Uncharacterized protein n=1 Tax=Liparis tanakae TaxID=230148 RepID=A0A4Z2GIG6_9TELE|nr:hypothetical protein EYF80_036800 [Liparis tanakae]